MKITPRKYQKEMLDATMEAMPNDQFILITAATGAGKTIYFSLLIKHLLNKWPSLRIAILAHRGLLIEQARDKLLSVWGEAPIGIASAGIDSNVDTDSNITIGTIQTLAKRLETTKPFDIIIVDEAHRIPFKNKDSQYGNFLNTMISYNKNVRVIGVTATPYQLNHGYIYGNVCRKGNENWFPYQHYRIGIKQLISQGYLCEYRAKEAANIGNDLKNVGVNGDYRVNELSDMMSKVVHVGSAVKAVQKYAQDRKRIIVFCVTIKHSEIVCDAFKNEGFNSEVLHSEMSKEARESTLREFEAGNIRVLCNVMVLSEGFDSPAIDCVVMCRPTKSPALFVQMSGRGLRPHPDKKNVLLLDLANNCSEHGDPDDPQVVVPNGKYIDKKYQRKCPYCEEVIYSKVKECPACGYEFEDSEIFANDEDLEMQDVVFNRLNEPYIVELEDLKAVDFLSKKGNRMIKLSLFVRRPGAVFTEQVNEFFIFDGPGGYYGRKKWKEIVKNDPPKSLEESKYRLDELAMAVPDRFEVIEEGRFLKIHRWNVAPWTYGDEVPF